MEETCSISSAHTNLPYFSSILLLYYCHRHFRAMFGQIFPQIILSHTVFRLNHNSYLLENKMGSEKMIEVATLGRPFSLGMLYDRRQDTVIPGKESFLF